MTYFTPMAVTVQTTEKRVTDCVHDAKLVLLSRYIWLVVWFQSPVEIEIGSIHVMARLVGVARAGGGAGGVSACSGVA